MADHDPNDTQLKRQAELWRARPPRPVVTLEHQIAELSAQIAALTAIIVLLHRDIQDFKRPHVMENDKVT
jgi:hypothetical protein